MELLLGWWQKPGGEIARTMCRPGPLPVLVTMLTRTGEPDLLVPWGGPNRARRGAEAAPRGGQARGGGESLALGSAVAL